MEIVRQVAAWGEAFSQTPWSTLILLLPPIRSKEFRHRWPSFHPLRFFISISSTNNQNLAALGQLRLQERSDVGGGPYSCKSVFKNSSLSQGAYDKRTGTGLRG